MLQSEAQLGAGARIYIEWACTPTPWISSTFQADLVQKIEIWDHSMSIYNLTLSILTLNDLKCFEEEIIIYASAVKMTHKFSFFWLYNTEIPNHTFTLKSFVEWLKKYTQILYPFFVCYTTLIDNTFQSKKSSYSGIK